MSPNRQTIVIVPIRDAASIIDDNDDQQVLIDLEEPLLEIEQSKHSNEQDSDDDDTNISKATCIKYGFLAGFLIQVWCASIFAYMTWRWGRNATTFSPPNNLTRNDSILYIVLALLSHVNVLSYFSWWCYFVVSLTETGREYIRRYLFVSPKQIFYFGVFSLVGLVLGSYAAWFTFDVLMYFSIPLFPLICSLAFTMILFMVLLWSVKWYH